MNEIYVSDEYWKENESMHVEDAEFKVDNAISLLRQCEFSPTSILDCGCGSGKHAYLMARECQVLTKGIDVSPGAVAHAQGEYALDNLSYEQISIAEVGENEFDLGLMFDVFEHVDDYIGFLRIAKTKAEYWLFNIPLDMNVISTVLGSYIKFRRQFGHLHYFSDRSALATLAYAGFDVVDSRYVFDAGHSIRARANFRNVIASLPRALLFRVSPSWCSRIFGGPSLMVLARNESTQRVTAKCERKRDAPLFGHAAACSPFHYPYAGYPGGRSCYSVPGTAGRVTALENPKPVLGATTRPATTIVRAMVEEAHIAGDIR